MVTCLIIPILSKRKALVLLVKTQYRRIIKNDKEKGYPPKANLAEGDEIIATFISQVNFVAHIKEWVVAQISCF